MKTKCFQRVSCNTFAFKETFIIGLRMLDPSILHTVAILDQALLFEQFCNPDITDISPALPVAEIVTRG